MHYPIPPERYFPYLTWCDIAALPDAANVVLIQPLGAIEQHGPHLPLGVDAAISTYVLARALQALDPGLPAYSLPPLYYGKSNEHLQFPGTITLSAQTLLAMLMEVGESLYRAGFRKWVLMNGHGGQPQVLDIAARDLHQRYPDFLVFPLFTWNVPNQAASLLSEPEQRLGIHAGDAETSVMLAILPQQVRLERAVKEYPTGLPDGLLSLEGALPFAWTTQDLSRSGVVGDAIAATPEKGEQILNSLARGWAQVIREIHGFRQPSPE